MNIPPEANLSPAATDILKKMICESEIRLGRNGAEEIKNHPFFEGVDWASLRKEVAPYQPNVSSEVSAENFDRFEEEEPFFTDNKRAGKNSRRVDINFIGYTYKADVELEKSMLVNVLKDLENVSDSQLGVNAQSSTSPKLQN